MKPGNLVKITRTSIGVPTGTIGLILSEHQAGSPKIGLRAIYCVYLMNRTTNGVKTHERRYLGRDLEMIK